MPKLAITSFNPTLGLILTYLPATSVALYADFQSYLRSDSDISASKILDAIKIAFNPTLGLILTYSKPTLLSLFYFSFQSYLRSDSDEAFW